MKNLTRPGPATTVVSRLKTDRQTTRTVMKSGRGQAVVGTGTFNLKATGSRRMPRSV